LVIPITCSGSARSSLAAATSQAQRSSVSQQRPARSRPYGTFRIGPMPRPRVCRQGLPCVSGLFNELHACAFDEALRLDGNRIEPARGDIMLWQKSLYVTSRRRRGLRFLRKACVSSSHTGQASGRTVVRLNVSASRVWIVAGIRPPACTGVNPRQLFIAARFSHRVAQDRKNTHQCRHVNRLQSVDRSPSTFCLTTPAAGYSVASRLASSGFVLGYFMISIRIPTYCHPTFH
jgi:hypothetical protein